MMFRPLFCTLLVVFYLPLTSSFLADFSRLDRSITSTTCRMTSTPQPTPSTTDVDKDTLQKVLDVAIDASKKAGEIILGNAGGAEVTKSKANSRDLLTLIDPLCEKVSTLPCK